MIAISHIRYDVAIEDVDEHDSDVESRNDRRQLYVVPADLSEAPRAISELRAGAGPFYLMSAAGYLLATWAGDGPTETRQYFLDGDSRKVLDIDDLPRLTLDGRFRSYDLVPSPNGDYLVVDYEEGDRSAIFVLDAFSLERVFVDATLPRGRAIWSGDDDLIFLSDEIEGALRLSAGEQAWAAIPEPDCKWPPTNSGPVAEDGTIIGPGTSLEDPVEFDATIGESAGRPLVPFGCP
jgi:hypothetical protein